MSTHRPKCCTTDAAFSIWRISVSSEAITRGDSSIALPFLEPCKRSPCCATLCMTLAAVLESKKRAQGRVKSRVYRSASDAEDFKMRTAHTDEALALLVAFNTLPKR